MKLALFDDYRLGVVKDEGIVDVTAALPQHDSGFAANFWVRLCHNFTELRPKIEDLAQAGTPRPLDQVRLRAAVLNPSKVLAAASNYGAHREEMRARGSQGWLQDFGVFLKAPSAIIGPEETIYLPEVGEREVHHEGELAFVIGKTGKDIPEERALAYVLGYTMLIDVTVRGEGDRSYRKSFDGFCPVGPWLVTADEIGDPHHLRIRLWVDGQLRQDVNSGDMLVNIPQMIAFASRAMTLYPGDLFTTGSPPGVGPIADGNTMTMEIEKIGRMHIYVKRPKKSGQG